MGCFEHRGKDFQVRVPTRGGVSMRGSRSIVQAVVDSVGFSPGRAKTDRWLSTSIAATSRWCSRRNHAASGRGGRRSTT